MTEQIKTQLPTADEIREMDIPSWIHPVERARVIGALANRFRLPYAVTYPFADAQRAKPTYLPVTLRLSKVIEFAEQHEAAMAVTITKEMN